MIEGASVPMDGHVARFDLLSDHTVYGNIVVNADCQLPAFRSRDSKSVVTERDQVSDPFYGKISG